MRILILLMGVFSLALAQDGARVYQQCQGCHQPSGTGIAGTFPPLAGHAPALLAAKNGRTYMIQVVLYGLQGSLKVKGQTYSGIMPAFARLSDADIAAVLNHISTSWGNKLPKGQKAFTAAEVKAQRSKKLGPEQVLRVRSQLGLK